MGKHDSGYERQERDFYPTPAWVTEALIEFFPVGGLTVWEPACGKGHMAKVLMKGGAKVIVSDIVHHRGFPHPLQDFLEFSEEPQCDMIATNPPFGYRGEIATAFIHAGLRYLSATRCTVLALLLPCDFDSAITRSDVFGECGKFAHKIVLRKRVVWFERRDGIRAAPKENSAWFVWRSDSEKPGTPTLLYAP